MALTLKRNSWHRRLQRYVLDIKTNREDDFANLCPYFWLTVFCLLTVPFVFLWRVPITYTVFGLAVILRTMVTIFDAISDLISYPFKKFICGPLETWYVETYLKGLSPEEVVRLRDLSGSNYKWGSFRDNKSKRLFERWRKAYGDEWFARLREYEDEVAKMRKQRAEEKEKAYQEYLRSKRERKENLMKLATTTQKFAPFLLILVGLPLVSGVVYGFYKIFAALWAVIPWAIVGHYVVKGLCWTGAVGICALVGWIVGTLAFKIMKKLFGKCWFVPVPFQFLWRQIRRPFKATGRWLENDFLEAVFNCTELLTEYVKAAKNNYCPKVEWKDE